MSAYEELQEKLDVERDYGHYFSCLCVFHDDHSPSMFVYEDDDKPDGKGRFYCSGCGKSGTHEYLLKCIGGGNRQISITVKKSKFLPNWSNWNDTYGSIENLVESAHTNLFRFSQFQSFFKKRKLMELAKPCMLGYKDGWAIFPIFDFSGKVIDAVVRNTLNGRSDTKYVIHPSTELTPQIYIPNPKIVIDSESVYVVYGIIDALALEILGLPALTGTTGKSLSNKRLINLGKRYVILPDRYEEPEAYRLSGTLGFKSSVKRLKYPDDCKDPDDVRMKYGNETLLKLIQGE